MVALLCVAGCSAVEVDESRELGRHVGVAVVPTATPPGMSLERRKEHHDSFLRVWETVRDEHWDPKVGGVDWDGARAEFEPQVLAAQSDDEVRDLLGQMLNRIGESHFGIVPSTVYREMAVADTSEEDADEVEDAAPKKERSYVGNGSVGIEARILGEDAFVFRIEDGSPAAGAGVQPGWKIVEVDGRDLSSSIARIREHNSDATSLQLMLAGAVHGRLGGRVGDEVHVVFDAQGEKKELELTLTPPTGTSTRFGHMPEMHFRYQSQRIAEDVGYLRFNMFMDPPTLARSFQESMEEFMDCRGVVIDIRGNPGGIGGMVMGMSGWLIDERGKHLGEMKTRQGTVKFAVFPRAETYQGSVAILIDGCSASTSEIFAQGLRDLERARLFGRRTSGAALPSLFTELPNGDRFQYAMADYTSISGHRIEGNGVNPDEPIALDPEALSRGEDPDMAAAIGWIRAGTQ